jgi:hypothetical protein
VAPENRSPPGGLTPKHIEHKLRPQAAPYEVRDKSARGLRLRVLPSGRKVFRWEVKLDGKTTPITIGPWSAQPLAGHVTLDDARDWLKKLKAARLAGTLDDVRKELDAKLALRGPRVLETGGDSELVSDLAELYHAKRIVPPAAQTPPGIAAARSTTTSSPASGNCP